MILKTRVPILLSAVLVSAVISGCATVETEQVNQTVVTIETSTDKPSKIESKVQSVTVSSSSDKRNEPPVNLPDKKPETTSVSSDTNSFL